jgi:hypothetical protein
MIKRKAGDINPREYNWKEQFDIDPKDINFAVYVEMDLGKVRGLAIYAEELQEIVKKLREVAYNAGGAYILLAGSDLPGLEGCEKFRMEAIKEATELLGD